MRDGSDRSQTNLEQDLSLVLVVNAGESEEYCRAHRVADVYQFSGRSHLQYVVNRSWYVVNTDLVEPVHAARASGEGVIKDYLSIVLPGFLRVARSLTKNSKTLHQ